MVVREKSRVSFSVSSLHILLIISNLSGDFYQRTFNVHYQLYKSVYIIDRTFTCAKVLLIPGVACFLVAVAEIIFLLC